MTEEQRDRWVTVLDYLIGALPAHRHVILVDGVAGRSEMVAARITDRLRARARPPLVVTDRAEVPAGADAFTVWVRSAGAHGADHADAVIDLHDTAWPVLRHLDATLLAHDSWYRTESRAFFAARAATWDTRFGDDLPAYASAVAEAGLTPGGVAVDVGCGTGRALPALRDALGPDGTVIGVDHTPQMLAAADAHARSGDAALLVGDVLALPFADATVDAVFAAGLLQHLPDPEAGLTELARITRDRGRLIVFHPSGRAALAARHGRALRPDELLAEPVLREAATRTGWSLTRYDDHPDRFYALAVRTR
ncbi:class I SAM-dependent methyltransferase [Catenuloplanes japonicus]|uniref:class I SAM-dependent methyltransferase n=1 Tax=Catenuloplanes japonicus TaxID=33876 RepID=UPI000A10EA90|nr:methyltransferase domain-containing protein [Catenuloplanes japonicus]